MMKKMKADGGSDKMMMKARVGLEGYCPVCIIDARKWEKGKEQISSTFDGVTYYFPTTGLKRKFDQSPERYVPVLNGDCIVCLEKAGKRVPGSVFHAVMHNQRLYLFPSDKEKKAFRSEPEAYASTDIAANGECIVCLVKAKKHVAGSTDHTVIHNGMRYLFPSDREAQMFRSNPDQFVAGEMKMMDGEKGMIKTSAPATSEVEIIVVGNSACAACEHGVSPLRDPEELGLALVGDDGQITVIEGAHKEYPELYKNRFKSMTLAATGVTLKQDGNVTWLKPSSLRQIP